MACVVDESFTISSPFKECIEGKPPKGAVDQSLMLSDIPGSKSQRPAEEKEWTESWRAIDLHSVMFSGVTPAGLGSLCVNTEAVYALVLLSTVPLEVQIPWSLVVWYPWFHQKEIYLNIHQAAVLALSLKDGSDSPRSNMTDVCSRLLMLCLWLTCSTAH